MANPKVEIQCPICKKQRFVTQETINWIRRESKSGQCLSCSLKGNKRRAGIMWSEDGRRKRIETLTGMKKTLEHRKHIAEAKTGVPLSDEHRKSLSEAQKRVAARRGSSYYREMGIKGWIKQQESKGPTDIEQIVYDALNDMEIEFISQFLVNDKFLVDTFVPAVNLVIECDGTYWHSLDRVIKRDRTKNAYLSACGYEILRLPGSEIRSGDFVGKLEEVLSCQIKS